MKRFSRLAPRWVAAFLAAFFVTAAQAQVLDQVPSDALVVMKINKLSAVNEKAAVLAKQWGLVEMNPAFADPLGYLLTESGMTNGVDKSGDVAIVMANGDLENHKKRVIILIPVTDYAAFIGNFPEAKKDGDLDVVHMTFSGEKDSEESYIANWGKYAAITPMKELLAKKPDGFKATGATAKELETKDLVVVVNFKVLGPMLDSKLKEHKDKMLDDMEKSFSKDEKVAKYVPLIKVVVTQALSAAQEFLGDTKAASFSINLNKEGVATSMMADFDAATYLGKAFSAMKGTGGSVLAGLPEAKYIFFGGGVSAGDTGKQMIADFLKPVEAELAKGGDEMKPFIIMVQGINKMMGAVKAQTAGVIAPSGAIGTTSLLQEVVLMTGDAKTLAEAQQQMLEAEQHLFELLPNKASGLKITFTPNAKTVDGVSFMQFTEDVTGTDQAAMQMKQGFTMMYGPNGLVGYTGILDDEHLLMTMGVDDATISAAIKAAREKTDALSKAEPVALVTKNLPRERIGAFYFDLGLTITTVTNYAKMMGMPIPVNIKPDLAPIGVALATDGPAIHVDSFIPADLIESIVTTTIQLKMMGAGGRGKPGGL